MSVVGIPSSGQAKEVLESYNKIRAFAPIAKAMCKLNLHTFNWLQLTSHSDNDTTRRIRFSTRKPSNPYLPVAIKRKRLRGAGRKGIFTTNPLLTSEGSEKNPSGDFSSSVEPFRGLDEFCWIFLFTFWTKWLWGDTDGSYNFFWVYIWLCKRSPSRHRGLNLCLQFINPSFPQALSAFRRKCWSPHIRLAMIFKRHGQNLPVSTSAPLLLSRLKQKQFGTQAHSWKRASRALQSPHRTTNP